MQEDTAKNFLKINVNLVAGLITIGLAFIGGVAWGVRLEDKTDQNAKTSEENKARIMILESSNAKSDIRFGILETKLDAIKSGIDDLKNKVR